MLNVELVFEYYYAIMALVKYLRSIPSDVKPENAIIGNHHTITKIFKISNNYLRFDTGKTFYIIDFAAITTYTKKKISTIYLDY